MFGKGVLEAILKRGEEFNKRKRMEYLQTLKHSNAVHLRPSQQNQRPCLLWVNESRFEITTSSTQKFLQSKQEHNLKTDC